MRNQENRLLTSELLEALASYPLYSQEHKKVSDLHAVALFRIGNIRWYILEGNAEGDRFTFFTLVCGLADCPELGYTDAGELAGIAALPPLCCPAVGLWVVPVQGAELFRR